MAPLLLAERSDFLSDGQGSEYLLSFRFEYMLWQLEKDLTATTTMATKTKITPMAMMASIGTPCSASSPPFSLTASSSSISKSSTSKSSPLSSSLLAPLPARGNPEPASSASQVKGAGSMWNVGSSRACPAAACETSTTLPSPSPRASRSKATAASAMEGILRLLAMLLTMSSRAASSTTTEGGVATGAEVEAASTKTGAAAAAIFGATNGCSAV
mmetsp:Transcript_13591/g.34155  ORF Transcript_13591/g.34155 Transcript_13591/m.34155 type:complete len:215 (+) Transcript_13591:68-712(+)